MSQILKATEGHLTKSWCLGANTVTVRGTNKFASIFANMLLRLSAIAVRGQRLSLLSSCTDRNNFVLCRNTSTHINPHQHLNRLWLSSSMRSEKMISTFSIHSSTPCVKRISWSVPGSASGMVSSHLHQIKSLLNT